MKTSEVSSKRSRTARHDAGESASYQSRTEGRLKAALEGFAAALIGNLSDLREEMRRGFEQMDKRFDTLDRRTERIETHLHALMLNTAGVN